MVRKFFLLPLLALLANVLPAQYMADFTVNNSGDPTFVFTNTSIPCAGPATTTYYWDFGDGNSSYAANPTHTYVNNGGYSVCLYMIDSVNNCFSSFCDSILVTNGSTSGTCNASFGAADSSGTTFFWSTSTSSSQITGYSWTFGDGTAGTGQYPNHQYNSPGNYLVCLTITTLSGCSDTYCDSVLVGQSATCNAAFTYTLDSLGNADFTSTSSAQAGISTYFWDFGNGVISTVANPSQTFPSGWYTVCLTITAFDGCTSTYCDYLYVASAPVCQAGFFSYPDSLLPNTTWIVNTSTGSNPNLPLSYTWDFGDGNTSTQAYPTHTYANSGVYNVCVTITDGVSCTSTFCDSVLAMPKTNTSWTINVIPNGPTAVEPPKGTVKALYPNPATDAAVLEITLDRSINAEIFLMNGLGQVVTSQTKSLNAGESRIDLDLNNLPAGLYFVKVRDLAGDPTNISAKLIKN